jgi:hypothetical protein
MITERSGMFKGPYQEDLDTEREKGTRDMVKKAAEKPEPPVDVMLEAKKRSYEFRGEDYSCGSRDYTGRGRVRWQ